MATKLFVKEQINNKYLKLCERHGLLPIKTTNFFQQKVSSEIDALNSTDGPLYRIVYPSDERIELIVPGERYDSVGDVDNMVCDTGNSIIRKYDDRIIFIPTNECVGHCQYCFRQSVLCNSFSNYSFQYKLDNLTNYLEKNEKITEVILSGGDPLILQTQSLAAIFKRLNKLSHIENIRIHTRALAYAPELLNDDEKLNLFAQNNVRLVFHFVHPYEICNKVIKVINKINDYKIRCYNQFPMLRKINDHPDVIIKLLNILDNLYVRNLSVFYPDAVAYSAAFRISFKRIFEIIDKINWHEPSWINAVKFTLDTAIGKVQRENLVVLDNKKNVAIFSRDGKTIEYPDFPKELDEAGELNILMWHG